MPRIHVYKDNPDGKSAHGEEARWRACKPRRFLAIVRFNPPQANTDELRKVSTNPFLEMASSEF
jgi:hypothetical protein